MERGHRARLADSGAVLADAGRDARLGAGAAGTPGAACAAARAEGRSGHGDLPMDGGAPGRPQGAGDRPCPAPPGAQAAKPRAAGEEPSRSRRAERGRAATESPPTRPCAAPAPPEGPQRRRLGELMNEAVAEMAGALTSLDGAREDVRAHTPCRGQTEAIALMFSHLQLRQPPPRAPWTLALMDAGLLLSAGLVRNRLWRIGHRELSLHLSDEGFGGQMCGRWRWRPQLGWQRRPWSADELAAGGGRRGRAAPPVEPVDAGEPSPRASGHAALALHALMHCTEREFADQLEDFQLNVCGSSRQLAALVHAGTLVTPTAVFAPGLEPDDCPAPPSASLLRGFDLGGPYLLSSRLLRAPEVVRSARASALARPLALEHYAAAPEDSESAILAELCAGRPVGALAELVRDQAVEVTWLDLPALRLADLLHGCGGLTPVYSNYRGRGRMLNAAALEGLSRQQMVGLLP